MIGCHHVIFTSGRLRTWDWFLYIPDALPLQGLTTPGQHCTGHLQLNNVFNGIAKSIHPCTPGVPRSFAEGGAVSCQIHNCVHSFAWGPPTSRVDGIAQGVNRLALPVLARRVAPDQAAWQTSGCACAFPPRLHPLREVAHSVSCPDSCKACSLLLHLASESVLHLPQNRSCKRLF